MEAKKCFWNGIAAVIGLVIVIGELFKGIPNGAFTIGSVLFILGGFLLMIGNSLLMFGHRSKTLYKNRELPLQIFVFV